MKLAVLIPAYNAGDELRRTLDSLATDPTPLDVVVVDDGSQPPVVVPASVGAHRLVLLRRERNGGVARALNRGLEWILARDYTAVARLDAGDTNQPERLTRQLAVLTQHPDMALVGSWTRHVDDALQPLYVTQYPASRGEILERLPYRTAFSHAACMMRASALAESGGYDEQFDLAEDYELFWRLASRYPCANVQEALVTRVESARSLTYTRGGEMARVRLRLQWRHFSWRVPACWLGLARSLALIALPRPMVRALKRAVMVVT